jgi:hypothetical protein
VELTAVEAEKRWRSDSTGSVDLHMSCNPSRVSITDYSAACAAHLILSSPTSRVNLEVPMG